MNPAGALATTSAAAHPGISSAAPNAANTCILIASLHCNWLTLMGCLPRIAGLCRFVLYSAGRKYSALEYRAAFPGGPRVFQAQSRFLGDRHGHHRAAYPGPPPELGRKNEGAGTRRFTAEAWRMHARLHDDAEEAQLGSPQGLPCPSHQRLRSYQLHRW